MTDYGNPITIATQGGEYSYHAAAARLISQNEKIEIDEYQKFGDVVKASRSKYPGLGVIAISTVAGTVEDSAKEIVRKRPSALPPVVGRVDVSIELALIGAREQTIEELGRQGVKCLGQKPAVEQCEDFLSENLPWIKVQFRGESTKAVKEVIGKDDPNFVAIGPSFAAEPLGGVVLGPNQINPPNSVTSFYILQRDPRQQILPIDIKKTSIRTVVSLAHPEGDGEINKSLVMADNLGIKIARIIPFDIGDYTKHNSGLRRGGGLFELEHDLYDEEVTEFCARVNGIAANDGVEGAFSTKKLGSYSWYREDPIDIHDLIISK